MQQHFRRRFAVSAALMAALVSTSGVAYSDSRASYSLATGASGPMTPQVSFTTAVHGATEREEMTITKPVTVDIVALADSGANTYTVMDPMLKIYVSNRLSEAPPDQFGIANLQELLRQPQSSDAEKTGTITNTVSVKDLGMDTPAGLTGTAHHFLINSHRVATGAAGSSDMKNTIDIWVDPALERPAMTAIQTTPRTIMNPNGATITYVLAGDVAAYNDIGRFLPVEIKAMTDQGPTTVTRTGSATNAQDPALFNVPSSYKKVTLADFVQDEQNALLDQLSGPQPKIPAGQAPQGP